MKIEHNLASNTAYIHLKEAPDTPPGTLLSQEVHPGIVLDINSAGELIGIEILDLALVDLDHVVIQRLVPQET